MEKEMSDALTCKSGAISTGMTLFLTGRKDERDVLRDTRETGRGRAEAKSSLANWSERAACGAAPSGRRRLELERRLGHRDALGAKTVERAALLDEGG